MARAGDDAEPTNFLYPFIDAQEDNPESLLADLAASAQAKAAESLALRRTTLEANADLLDQAASEMARRFAAGGRMFTFGNGGSCTEPWISSPSRFRRWAAPAIFLPCQRRSNLSCPVKHWPGRDFWQPRASSVSTFSSANASRSQS